jgi:hypothetical protein
MLSSLPRSFQSNRVFLRRVNEQFEQFNDFRKSWKSARKKDSAPTNSSLT